MNAFWLQHTCWSWVRGGGFLLPPPLTAGNSE
nr:MAG TPA: hypothetical protein [Caudoviricetes sp.]